VKREATENINIKAIAISIVACRPVIGSTIKMLVVLFALVDWPYAT